MYGGRGADPFTGGTLLPNTGEGWLTTVASIVTIIVGVVIITTTIAYIVAKRSHKAKAAKA